MPSPSYQNLQYLESQMHIFLPTLHAILISTMPAYVGLLIIIAIALVCRICRA